MQFSHIIILLRSFKYKEKDYDNVLSCGEMVDNRIEEKYFTEDNEYGFEDLEILETEPEDVHASEGCVFETDTTVPATSYDNWLKQNLSGKSELKKLIVLKEILGKPRSICPYTGNYYQ